LVRSVRDDANILGYGNVYPIADIGELSARLRPGTAYHRIGNYFYYNGFESGLGLMVYDLAAGNNYCNLVNDEAFSGSVSLHLQSDVNLYDFAGIRIFLPPLDWTSFGCSFAFKCPFAIGVIYFYIRVVNSPYVMQAGIKYKDATHLWTAVDTSLVETTIATNLEVWKSALMWHHIYFSFDAENKLFKKLIFDGKVIDLSKITISQMSTTEHSHIVMAIYAFGDGSNATDMYIYSVAFSQNVEH